LLASCKKENNKLKLTVMTPSIAPAEPPAMKDFQASGYKGRLVLKIKAF
jgi:hypothetical protein